MNKHMFGVALASLLVGGVAVAAFNSFRGDKTPENGFITGSSLTAANAPFTTSLSTDLVDDRAIQTPAPPASEYADVIDVEPVSEKQALYATVIGTDPVRETSTVSTPREVCDDIVVQDRLPERDGNVGGTVAGALIGGLIGNQVGGGTGKKLATVAGAVGGGYVGNRVDRNHVGGRVGQRVDRQCRTVLDSSQSSRVVGYNVTYRNPDGTTGTMRTGSKPGSRISLGSENKVVGYDVTYRYRGQEQTIRLDDRPGQRLPVIDGQVMTQAAAASAIAARG